MKEKITPLHAAAMNGHLDTVRYLVSLGMCVSSLRVMCMGECVCYVCVCGLCVCDSHSRPSTNSLMLFITNTYTHTFTQTHAHFSSLSSLSVSISPPAMAMDTHQRKSHARAPIHTRAQSGEPAQQNSARRLYECMLVCMCLHVSACVCMSLYVCVCRVD